ncbi:hypothetical protein CRM73_00335 [Kocuria sp. CCUG 69068]|uniref:hypothetical protein n=1 Tax=Kocuria sp. CCUG 69068 TaxID=2043138 RepID=UPI001E5F7E83|nr:hypothetical protein [Kocuria sp. CCUG 69068]
MPTNDSPRPVPTPAELHAMSRAVGQARLREFADSVSEEIDAREKTAKEERDDARFAEAHREEQSASPTPADVVPALSQSPFHRVPVVELTREQRLRVEALHAARRVLGNPHTKGGQIAAAWAQQTIELADYIVTGDVFQEFAQDEVEGTDARPEPAARPDGVRVIEIDPDKPLPADAPPALHAFVRQMKEAAAVAADPEARAQRTRAYVDSVRSRPDGLKELNAQGYFPVDGSEPPRDEPLHDAYCRRWAFNQETGRWTREVLPSDVTGKPSIISAAWGPVLAEHGPFHFCG